MSTNEIHPTLKDALLKTVNRKAPLGLHAKIMQRVYASRAAKLAAPSATPWVVLALLFAAAMIVLPLLPQSLLKLPELGQFAMPKFTLSNATLFSILGLICLYALSELPSGTLLKKRP